MQQHKTIAYQLDLYMQCNASITSFLKNKSLTRQGDCPTLVGGRTYCQTPDVSTRYLMTGHSAHIDTSTPSMRGMLDFTLRGCEIGRKDPELVSALSTGSSSEGVQMRLEDVGWPLFKASEAHWPSTARR